MPTTCKNIFMETIGLFANIIDQRLYVSLADRTCRRYIDPLSRTGETERVVTRLKKRLIHVRLHANGTSRFHFFLVGAASLLLLVTVVEMSQTIYDAECDQCRFVIWNGGGQLKLDTMHNGLYLSSNSGMNLLFEQSFSSRYCRAGRLRVSHICLQETLKQREQWDNKYTSCVRVTSLIYSIKKIAHSYCTKGNTEKERWSEW